MKKQVTKKVSKAYRIMCEKLDLSVSEAVSSNLTLAELKSIHNEYESLAIVYS